MNVVAQACNSSQHLGRQRKEETKFKARLDLTGIPVSSMSGEARGKICLHFQATSGRLKCRSAANMYYLSMGQKENPENRPHSQSCRATNTMDNSQGLKTKKELRAPGQAGFQNPKCRTESCKCIQILSLNFKNKM